MADRHTIPIPRMLGTNTMWSRMCMGMCRRTWQKEYDGAIKIIEADMNRNMCVVNQMRRQRMHGIALASLIDKPAKAAAAGVAYKKNLDVVRQIQDGNVGTSLW